MAMTFANSLSIILGLTTRREPDLFIWCYLGLAKIESLHRIACYERGA